MINFYDIVRHDSISFEFYLKIYDFPHDDAGNLYFIISSRVDNPKKQSIYKSCCRKKYSKRLVRGNWVFCIKIRFT